MADQKNTLINGLQKLEDEDTSLVSGGVNTSVYNPAGLNDIAYTCPKCGFKVEINTKQKWEDGTYKNEWSCPQCRSKNMSIFTYKKNKVFANSINGSTYEVSDIKNLDL